MRWLWLCLTKPDNPWAGLLLSTDNALYQFFIRSLEVYVGNGRSVLFWTEPWLDGLSIEDLAPHLAAAVSTRTKKKRTVAQALHHRAWLKDVTGALMIPVLIDYVQIRLRTDQVLLQPDVDDTFAWRWTGSRNFTVVSANQALFFGQTAVLGAKELWKIN